MIIDLHCHTKISDGSSSIEEIVQIAALKKIEIIALTDHDTFAGCTRAQVIGKRRGVTVMPAVEISAYDYTRKRKAHILCYNPENGCRLEGLMKKILDNRKAAMNICIQKVCRMYPLPPEMILSRGNGSTCIYKQHIMAALMDAGYAGEMFGDVFKKLFNPRFGLASTRVEYPDVGDVIDAVHYAGGIAVLAHPSVYNSMDLMEELCEKKMIDGIELNHPRNSDEDKETIRQCCEKYGRVMTGGTDFHGFNTTNHMPIGSYITEELQYQRLMKIKV